MKLTIQHLSPYLPYGLKYATLSDDNDEYYIDSKHNEIGVGGNQSNVTNICLVEYSRPIYRILLRPLSHLAQEIEHNGERFVPSEYCNTDFTDLIDNPENFKFCQWNIGQLLISWHFDVFGLIEQGLALPILGICVEKGCERPATSDYNGHGHYVCKQCNDSLNRHFDEEYR